MRMTVQRRDVALVSDFVEEGWTSMDLVAEMLAENLCAAAPDLWSPELLRIPMLRPLSAFRKKRFGRLVSNSERAFNRFVTYAAYLRIRAHQFPLFHITDHSYAHLVHAVPRARTVVTCHDLDAFQCLTNPVRYPKPIWFRAMAARTLAGLQRACRIICVSEIVRAELLATGLVADRKISVVHNGAHPACTPLPAPDADGKALQKAGVGNRQRFLLHVGSTVSRKRIDILLQAFARIRQQHPQLLLVRVGGPLTEEQTRMAADLGVAPFLRSAPFLERSELATLYRHAETLLLTSEAEGFGLPLVEAMACGCPVVASDLPVTREVCGEAGEFCPVADVDAWAVATSTLLMRFGKSAESRAQKRLDCLRRAQRFSWFENARQISGIYAEVLSQSRLAQ